MPYLKAIAATVASVVVLWLADKGFIDEAMRLEVEEIVASALLGLIVFFVPNRPTR